MKKNIIFSVSFLLIFSLITFSVYYTNISIVYGSVSKYEQKFEDMNNLPKGIFNIDEILQQDNLAKRGVQLRFKRILPFSEAIQLSERDPKDYNFISEDTQVWVVQGYIPILEHLKFGHLENVLVTNYYDVSSGELLGSTYIQLD